MNPDLIIIAILIVYIGFIHYQLHKKNQLIEDILKKQGGFESILSKEGIETIVKKIKEAQKHPQAKASKIFEDNIQNFILKDEKTEILYVHYTKDQDVAQKICDEGFIFADSFHKTAEIVTSDKLDFVYKHYLRKQFGKYVVVIAIGKDVYNHYQNIIKQSNKVLTVEQVISKKLENNNEDSDEVFWLPNVFIKGYINSETGEICANNSFNPKFNSPDFEKNLINS